MKPYLAFTTPVFLVSILVTLLLTGEPGSSQGLLRRLDTANPQPGGRFGEEVATGDVNGDGRADIAVGAVQEDVGAVPDAGRVYVFDGATGALIYGLNTPNPQRNAFFGAALALGDVDADGKNDIAVGAHFETVAGHTFQGRVYIFSATSGTLLRILDTPQPENAVLFGRSLAMGDADGDGKDDIAVGAPQQTAGQVEGKVYLFSGATGDLILTLDAPTQQQLAKFGSSLAMGEVDGDGKADIAVGAPREFTNIQGRAYVYSGDGGGLLYTLDSPAPKPSGLFGSALAMGDADGDGRADISVGAEGEAVTGGHSQHGRAYLFSGASGALLSALDSPNISDEAHFGRSVGMSDATGDGRADVVVGAPSPFSLPGRAHLFNGANGAHLLTLESPDSHNDARFGEAVALGDMNGDGKADVAVGAPSQNVPLVSPSPTPSAIPSPAPSSTPSPSPSPSPGPTPSPFAGNVGQGRVYLFDPAPTPTPTPTPDDSDTDGWSDSAEGTIGTDPLDACADDPFDDAWPADIDNNGFSDTGDIAVLANVFGASVPAGAPPRYDIGPDPPDGFVDTADIARITGLFGVSCV